MLKSSPFNVKVVRGYAVKLSRKHIKPFLDSGKKRVRAKASSGTKTVEFHAALQKRGQGYYMIFSKSKQQALEISPGDTFQLEFFEDTSKYGVEVPEELQVVFDTDYGGHKIFDTLTDGAKRGLIYAISRYKYSQTRIDKSLLVLENLKRGLRDRGELLKS